MGQARDCRRPGTSVVLALCGYVLLRSAASAGPPTEISAAASCHDFQLIQTGEGEEEGESFLVSLLAVHTSGASKTLRKTGLRTAAQAQGHDVAASAGAVAAGQETTADQGVPENLALVFIKPHANTPAVREMVPKFFEDHKVHVVKRGTVTSETINELGLIDLHYEVAARGGMAADARNVHISDDAAKVFQDAYGISPHEVVEQGRMYSGIKAMELLGVDASELLQRSIDAGYVRIASGYHLTKLKGPDGGDVYVINGYYPRMREKFTAPGVEVNWFVLSFKESEVSWSDFRNKLIGLTDFKKAFPSALRPTIHRDWKKLGLTAEPNVQDNGVHASAGPLEALRERLVWTGASLQDDPFGAALLARGFTEQRIQELMQNPEEQLQGHFGRVFDLTEDTDTSKVLEMLTG